MVCVSLFIVTNMWKHLSTMADEWTKKMFIIQYAQFNFKQERNAMFIDMDIC